MITSTRHKNDTAGLVFMEEEPSGFECNGREERKEFLAFCGSIFRISSKFLFRIEDKPFRGMPNSGMAKDLD